MSKSSFEKIFVVESSMTDSQRSKEEDSSECCSPFAPQGSKRKLLLIFGVLSAATNFPEGYCNSYPNTSYQSFKSMINGTYVARGAEGGLSPNAYTWYWSTVLNIWFIGYLIGTFATPYFTDNFGRKKALLIANAVALLGAVLSIVSVIWSIPELFLISRVVASTSSGISFGSLILFLQEATPTEHRGVTSFLSESTFIFTTAIGIGFGMDIIFGKNLSALTGFSIIPAVISILIVLPLKETPKFQLINRNNRELALQSIEFYRGKNDENDAVLDDMLLEKDEKDDQPLLSGIAEVFSEGQLLMAFLLGGASLQIVVSIWPIMYLSTDLLENNFDATTAQWASFGFIMADFAASVCGIAIIERAGHRRLFGRRHLLLSLGWANTVCLCLYIISDLLIPVWDPARYGQIGALIIFGATYGIGLGPIAFFITSELVAQRSRSIVQSMVFALNTVMNCALSFATLPAFNYFGVLSFVPLFIIPSVLCLIFLHCYLPETANREVHDVVEELCVRHNKRRRVESSQSTMTESVSLAVPKV